MLVSVDSKTRQEGEEGNLSRKTITLLGVLAALAAVVLATVAGTAQARTHDSELTGAGSSFVAPLVSAWTPKVQSAL